MLFKITEYEGLNYSKVSRDKNKIHTDKLAGYNSIFGKKICHGTLVVSKIFKNKEFRKIISSKKEFNIYINFLDFTEYDKNLLIKKAKNKFHVIQNKKKYNLGLLKLLIYHISYKELSHFLAIEFDTELSVRKIKSCISYIFLFVICSLHLHYPFFE